MIAACQLFVKKARAKASADKCNQLELSVDLKREIIDIV